MIFCLENGMVWMEGFMKRDFLVLPERGDGGNKQFGIDLVCCP